MRLRQRGLAARRRKCDQERLARRAQERERRHSHQQRGGAHDNDHEEEQRGVERPDERAQRREDREAMAADRAGHRAEHADRRETHHVAGDLEHHLGHRVEQRHQPGAAIAEGGQPHAEERREDDDLQHVAARHRVHDGRGRQVQHQIPAGLLLLHHRDRRRRVAARLQRQHRARLDDVDHQQADGKGDGRRQLEPHDRLEPDPADCAELAGARNAHDQRRKDERRQDHLDQAQEDVGQWTDGDAGVRPHGAEDDAKGEPDEDLCGQAGAPHHRVPPFSASASAETTAACCASVSSG